MIPNVPHAPGRERFEEQMQRRTVHAVLYVRREGDLRKRTVGLADKDVERLSEIARAAGSWKHGREWPKLVRLAVLLLIEAHAEVEDV